MEDLKKVVTLENADLKKDSENNNEQEWKEKDEKLFNSLIGESKLFDQELTRRIEYKKRNPIENGSKTIDPMEAMDDEGAISTLISNRRSLAITSKIPKKFEELLKKGFTILPIQKGNGEYHYIIYNDKEKASRLREIMEKHGGYLSDETPEEAREIGNLLQYDKNSIESYVRRKYENKKERLNKFEKEDLSKISDEELFDQMNNIGKKILDLEKNKERNFN